MAGLFALGIGAWNGLGQKTNAPPKPELALSIQPKDMADALRAVVAAHREVYTLMAAQRPEDKSLPNPCGMLRRTSEATASKGVEFSYLLRSLQPINRRNAPETEVEKKGLEFLATHADSSYSSKEIQGGRWYFTAVYPDVAFHQSCADCHNRRPESLRKDYKLGDVMGAMVIRIALEL